MLDPVAQYMRQELLDQAQEDIEELVRMTPEWLLCNCDCHYSWNEDYCVRKRRCRSHRRGVRKAMCRTANPVIGVRVSSPPPIVKFNTGASLGRNLGGCPYCGVDHDGLC